MRKTSNSFEKRKKEQARKEKQLQKAERRAQRARERAERPDGESSLDAAISGIVPGPQPAPDEE